MTDFRVRNGTVAGRDGGIPIRDYLLATPATPATSTPFLWVHGGGFVSGGLDQKESDAPARFLASRGRWVRTIDYRLAPNNGVFREPKLGPAKGRFPEAHHDVLDVAAALREEAGAPISIGGASAGANLAAGAVLAMIRDGTELPRSLVLLYGVLHAVLPDSAELGAALRGPIARWAFNPAMTRRMNLNYVGAEAGLTDPIAFPGGADLRGFPPTLTVDATNDRLRASGHAFHGELTAAGVTTEELVVPAMHGFLSSPKRPPFAVGMAAVDSWLTRFDA